MLLSQPILWHNLDICVHSEQRPSKTDCNIAILIRIYSVEVFNFTYILYKHDEDRSSNARDYEGNKCIFSDEMAKNLHIPPIISANYWNDRHQIFSIG